MSSEDNVAKAKSILLGTHQVYYGECTYEAIYVIKAFKLNFNLGSAIKYLKRAGKKTIDREIDLAKAYWYLKEELENQYQHPIEMQRVHIEILNGIDKDWGLTGNIAVSVKNILMVSLSPYESGELALKYAMKALSDELESLGVTDSPF